MLATKIACPRCSKKLRTPKPVGVGKHLRCSRCDHPFQVRLEDMRNPQPGEEPANEDLNQNGKTTPEDMPASWNTSGGPATAIAPAPAVQAAPLPETRPAAAPRRSRWWLPVLIVLILVVLTAGAVTLTIYLGQLADRLPDPKVLANLPSDFLDRPSSTSQGDTQPAGPPPSPLELLPPEERSRITRSIERGLAYVRKSQDANGTWAGGYPIGMAALAGLALLECDVPADDPQIKKTAAYLRTAVVNLDRTYELSAAILFFDRLGDRADEKLIQTLSLRLIAGQTAAGGYHYGCTVLKPEDEGKLLTALRETRPHTVNDLFVIGPNGKKPDWFKSGPETSGPTLPTNDPAKVIAGLPPHLQRIPALQTPAPGKPFPTSDTSDNSNTQFAALGLWVAGRHGVPVERALALLTTRFRLSQGKDGGWNYHYNPANTSSPAMTGAGLLGLAVGHGLVAEHTLPPPEGGNTGEQRVVPDQSLAKGLNTIAQHIGQPTGKAPSKPAPGKEPLNLYFLWTLERVAVLYSLPKIEGKDWYRWGAEQLVEVQTDQGYWHTNGYHGSCPVLDTSLALLFLKRANVAKDLTSKIEYLGRVRESKP